MSPPPSRGILPPRARAGRARAALRGARAEPHALSIHQAIWRALTAAYSGPLVDHYSDPRSTRSSISTASLRVAGHRSTELLWQCPHCHDCPRSSKNASRPRKIRPKSKFSRRWCPASAGLLQQLQLEIAREQRVLGARRRALRKCASDSGVLRSGPAQTDGRVAGPKREALPTNARRRWIGRVRQPGFWSATSRNDLPARSRWTPRRQSRHRTGRPPGRPDPQYSLWPSWPRSTARPRHASRCVSDARRVLHTHEDGRTGMRSASVSNNVADIASSRIPASCSARPMRSIWPIHRRTRGS